MGVPEQNDSFSNMTPAEQPPPYSESTPSYDDLTRTSPQHPSDTKHPLRPEDEKSLPPPSYSGQPESSLAASQRPSAPTTSPPLFPQTFNLYAHFSTYTLGPHASTPLFTLRATSLRKPLTLLSGPSKTCPPLATLKLKGLGSTSRLTILPAASPELLSAPLEITIENHAAYHAFSIALPGAPPTLYEWRASKADEVASLGAYKCGWKLVRLRGGDRSEVEIVAASALNNSASLSKGLVFGFFGAGAHGGLGRVFEVAAVLTAVSDYEVFLSTNVAIGGDSGAGKGKGKDK